MALSVLFRPNSAVLWSKSYFQYQLQGQMMTVGNKVQYQFCRYDNDQVLSDNTMPIINRTQTFTLSDCQELIDPHLLYVMPTPGSPYIVETYSNIMRVYIRFRELAPGTNPPWISDKGNPRVVIKGGISDLVFRSEFDTNHSTYSRERFTPFGDQFLTWIPADPDRRILHKDEQGWLMVHTDSAAAPWVTYNVFYMDGSNYAFKRALPVNGNTNYLHRTFYLPIGIEQANLDPGKKGVFKYRIGLYGVGISTYGTFDIDHRPFRNAKTLYYRNSFGGMDHIHLHGIIALSTSDPDKKEYSQHRTFLAANMDGETPYFRSKLKFRFKANTGFISKAHKLALADLINTTFCALIIDNQFIPMRVPPQKFEPIGSQDGLHSYSIEFETAGEFETLPRQLFDLL